MWYFYTTEFYSAIKRKNESINLQERKKAGIVVLNKMSQTQTD